MLLAWQDLLAGKGRCPCKPGREAGKTGADRAWPAREKEARQRRRESAREKQRGKAKERGEGDCTSVRSPLRAWCLGVVSVLSSAEWRRITILGHGAALRAAFYHA